MSGWLFAVLALTFLAPFIYLAARTRRVAVGELPLLPGEAVVYEGPPGPCRWDKRTTGTAPTASQSAGAGGSNGRSEGETGNVRFAPRPGPRPRTRRGGPRVSSQRLEVIFGRQAGCNI